MTEIEIDKLLRRQAYLIRYSKSFSNDIVNASIVGDRKLISLIRDYVEDASQSDLDSMISGGRRTKRTTVFIASLTKIFNEQEKAVQLKSESELKLLVTQEIAKTQKAFNEPKKVKLNESSILKTPILGASIASIYANLYANHKRKIEIAIVSSIQNNQNPVDQIKGTRDAKFKNGLLWKRERDIRMHAETSVFGVVNNTRKEIFTAYQITEEVILSTLDHRTCLVCSSYDRDVYKVGEGPYPSFHNRCRCIRIPWTGDKEERPFVADDRSVKNIPQSERKNKIGTTKYDYDQWFDRQPASFKRSHLGKTKYEAYKAGKLSLDDMVNGKTNRVYTLDDLELKE